MEKRKYMERLEQYEKEINRLENHYEKIGIEIKISMNMWE